MPATNLAIRDKIARELQNRETLPWALENRKLFPNAIFGNNEKYSPLQRAASYVQSIQSNDLGVQQFELK